MSILELKNLLIQRITEINDRSFLEAIKTILDAGNKAEVMIVPEDRVREINVSKQEIKEGYFVDNNKLEDEIDQWLAEK